MFPTYALHIHALADRVSTTEVRREAPEPTLELHVIAWPCDRGSVAWLALGEGGFVQFLKVGRA
jgi:hypothetical protein